MKAATAPVNSASPQMTQQLALNALGEVLGLLNTQSGDRYLFSWLAADRPAVESIDRVLDGDGATSEARQLVLEALARTPNDPDAKQLLASLERKLGIEQKPTRLPIDPAPLPSEYADPIEPPPEEPPSSGHVRPSGLVRYGGGVLGGAIAGGLFADVVTGLDGTTEDDVLGGAVLGAAAGGLTAYLLTRNTELTTGDHALIDSMAAWGLVGGLTFGLALDPPEGEAYSLNGVIGIAGGYLIGHAAARKTDLSTARMTRVNLAAFVGALTPWLLYAATSDDETNDDEQAFGFLSTVGLLGGAYLGFRWTRNMKPGSGDGLERDPAPAALFQRTRAGWTAGGIGLSRVQGSRGATLSVLSGSW
ncbi:MAG: hypothetical protein K8M05_12690 [Deltaproteobacteria bacterium]|nr:hypothetical protein [Kofleriaceae bacterium]